jgi:hypothetical protein
MQGIKETIEQGEKGGSERVVHLLLIQSHILQEKSF